MIAKAREDSRQGDFRWVAEVLNQVVYAEPANRGARSCRRMRSSSSATRPSRPPGATPTCSARANCATASLPAARRQRSAEFIGAMPASLVFDCSAVRLNPARAAGRGMVLNWTFADSGRTFVLELDHSALTHTPGRLADRADAGFTLTRATFDAVMRREQSFAEAVAAGEIRVDGDARRLAELMAMLDEPAPMFPIVEPK